MSPPRIPVTGALLPYLDGRAGDLAGERVGHYARAEGTQGSVAAHHPPGRTTAPERRSRARSPHSDSTDSVLSAPQFDRCLERECSLADRGTRRFSVLVLQRRAGEHAASRGHDGLSLLAQRSVERLRSTDLVGRLDTLRLEILLTDTLPAGAQVVAAWVERAGAELGLHLERSIFVYPSVTEPAADPRLDDGPRNVAGNEGVRSRATVSTRQNGNGHHPERKNGHRGRRASPPTDTVRSGTRGSVIFGRAQDRAADHALGRPWPMSDLWPLLNTPTPRWKRAFDILLATFGLVALSPLFALIALAIRLDSAGPVIFRQMRGGRGGRPFVFYKFRSMTVDAESLQAGLADRNEQDGPIFKIRDDPRITRLGRLLRRGSIDELPQLWNVLKGDISLVGPRSPTMNEVGQYERWQRRRLSVAGGITCTWQVSGRSRISFQEWMRLDMRYVACHSLWLDLRLLLQTLPAVISGRGAS